MSQLLPYFPNSKFQVLKEKNMYSDITTSRSKLYLSDSDSASVILDRELAASYIW